MLTPKPQQYSWFTKYLVPKQQLVTSFVRPNKNPQLSPLLTPSSLRTLPRQPTTRYRRMRSSH